MVEVGLDNVANNPNLTFIFFIGLTILAALSARFAYYARRNRIATDGAAGSSIWRHLVYIGVFGAVYGLAGILEIVTSVDLPHKSAAMLGMTLVLALAIRRIHDTTTSADGGRARSHPLERAARTAFVGLVVVDLIVVTVLGVSAASAVVEGVAALAFAGYGLAYYRDQTSQSRLQGTMLDSLLRHLLPVLTFAALVSVVGLAIPFGLDRVVVLHVQVVFIIMTATALMTGTIKLQQNLASL